MPHHIYIACAAAGTPPVTSFTSWDTGTSYVDVHHVIWLQRVASANSMVAHIKTWGTNYFSSVSPSVSHHSKRSNGTMFGAFLSPDIARGIRDACEQPCEATKFLRAMCNMSPTFLPAFFNAGKHGTPESTTTPCLPITYSITPPPAHYRYDRSLKNAADYDPLTTEPDEGTRILSGDTAVFVFICFCFVRLVQIYLKPYNTPLRLGSPIHSVKSSEGARAAGSLLPCATRGARAHRNSNTWRLERRFIPHAQRSLQASPCHGVQTSLQSGRYESCRQERL